MGNANVVQLTPVSLDCRPPTNPYFPLRCIPPAGEDHVHGSWSSHNTCQPLRATNTRQHTKGDLRLHTHSSVGLSQGEQHLSTMQVRYFSCKLCVVNIATLLQARPVCELLACGITAALALFANTEFKCTAHVHECCRSICAST